ncbi:MAG: UbiD family decarboxylase [Candidatus Melainabacteria bacterium]|nr:UbiD family decarboxylase [Candidatus Melainabacteria bacterium]
MAYRDLRTFLKKLEELGELVRIICPVSPYLEISEITNRLSKGATEKNKALLFENVSGYQIPLLINTLGSYKRMNLALGVNSFKEIAERIEKFLDKKIPDDLLGKLSMLPKLAEAASFPPKIVSSAPCQEVVITNQEEPMLDKLPIITAWPGDAAPFITMTVVVTKDPKTGTRNVGMYRLQKINNTTTCMHWHKHHDGAQNYLEKAAGEEGVEVRGQKTDKLGLEIEANGDLTNAKSSVLLKERQAKDKEKSRLEQDFSGKRKMEVAVAIGCDPAVMYSASAPLPPGVDEFLFAGFLRGSPVELVKCKTVDLEVPATSEIVLEGYVDLNELTTEGPFGDHTGFYSLAGMFPEFHITAMTHKKDPIYTTIIVGKPPMEDCYMGKATEQIFLPLIRVFLPEVVDLNLPLEGVFHNCAIISIKKKYPAHGKKVINAIWGMGQMMFTKYVIVVDDDIDIHNLSNLAFHVFSNTDPKRDSVFTEGPTDILDHAASTMAISGKMGLDATRKWKSEGYIREWPSEMVMDEATKGLVTNRWKEYGL